MCRHVLKIAIFRLMARIRAKAQLTSDRQKIMTAPSVKRHTLWQILENRRWIWRKFPYPHAVATDVFKEEFYCALETQIKGILERNFVNSTEIHAHKFAHYDAYAYAVPPDVTGPLTLFTSAEWHNMLVDIAGVRACGRVNVTLHHHEIGSANGRVHNDLNPGWFYDYLTDGGIILPSHNICDYRHGFGAGVPSRKREFVRSAALLFYVCNSEWHRGDGGETGLYSSHSDPVDRPIATVPPLNNSLLFFECTPYSYHSFLSNTRASRNVIVMWLHCDANEVIGRWGDRSIVRWPDTSTLRER